MINIENQKPYTLVLCCNFQVFLTFTSLLPLLQTFNVGVLYYLSVTKVSYEISVGQILELYVCCMYTTIRSLSYAYHNFELVLQINIIMSIQYYVLTMHVRGIRGTTTTLDLFLTVLLTH